MERLPVPVYHATASGRLLYANRAFRELLGHPASGEWTCVSLAGLHVVPGERTRLSDLVAREGVVRDFETSLRREDGTVVRVLDTARAVHDAEGELVRYEGVLRVVSGEEAGRERTLEALRASEERFRMVMEHAGDAVLLHDEEGALVSVNQRACDALGYSREELLGMTIHDFELDAARSDRVGDRLLSLQPGEIVTMEGRQRRKDGEVFPVEVRVGPVVLGGRRLFLALARDVSARKEAEEALRESEERYRTFFDSNPQPMWVYEMGTLRFLAVNEEAVRHYGWTREEFMAMTLADIRPPEDVPAMLEAALRPGAAEAPNRTWRHRTKAGELLDVEISAESVDFEGRRARLVVVTDVTERTRLETRLRQAQKMEAIGRLAGGVAHDFNNLLTVIQGSCDLLVRDTPEGDSRLDDLEEIRRAAERAAELTSQLLAFGRKQMRVPRVIDLNALAEELHRLIGRVIGADLDVRTELDPAVVAVEADSTQIHQVLFNLCLNARDAMPDGGTLTISTANVRHDPASAEQLGLEPGRFARLSVRDTGVGMDEATRARAFEPFFTTKGPGKGTGLGLSTVYGIVKQSGGHVGVESEPGRGTIVSVDLPEAHPGARRSIPEAEPPPPDRVGEAETILLVEDEGAVRRLARQILERRGYTVHAAENANEGRRLFALHGEAIRLLLTDVVMPGESGPELASALRAARPALPVVFMSGYTGDALAEQGTLAADVPFVQKPFAPDHLVREVRRAIGD